MEEVERLVNKTEARVKLTITFDFEKGFVEARVEKSIETKSEAEKTTVIL